jgi:hypothetical protein
VASKTIKAITLTLAQWGMRRVLAGCGENAFSI